MKVSHNPLGIAIESFEEFRTASAAIEADQGTESSLVERMREAGRTNFDYRNGKFSPVVFRDQEAAIVVGAMDSMARRTEHHMAPVAAYIMQNTVEVQGPITQQAAPEVPAFVDFVKPRN